MEILAPAGDKAMLRAAVFSGADCIYLGVEGFNARKGAANFGGGENSIPQAVSFCHARNCRVYAAVNTLCRPGKTKELEQAVSLVKESGCDGIIVQDLQTAAMAKSVGGLDIHGSTQMSVHSLEGVKQLHELGFSRVILARELSMDDIAYIAKYSPIELEVFVHGALCISVSGQCYMSAFIGGGQRGDEARSANGGSCASPCRLPFRVEQPHRDYCDFCGDSHRPENNIHALSLKDLSIIDYLPILNEMGITSAKIEGRLRGPEYCAAVVSSARKTLAGEKYDKGFLGDIFSRSGEFTDCWLKPVSASTPCKVDGSSLFGKRTETDSVKSKKALPAARELYRREMARVPVEMELEISEDSVSLKLSDGGNIVEQSSSPKLEKARSVNNDALEAVLEKTGGTPFYLSGKAKITNKEGWHLPSGELSPLRRNALAKLLEIRESAPSKPIVPWGALNETETVKAKNRNYAPPAGKPMLKARFDTFSQMPAIAPEICSELLFPLEDAENVPVKLRFKSRLYLPRVLFGDRERKVREMVKKASSLGYAGFEVWNIGQFSMCKGQNISTGFGLNISNSGALAEYAKLGAKTFCLSPELNIFEIEEICKEAQKEEIACDIICYGYLPLMLTRSCPSKCPESGNKCMKKAALVDRTGRAFPLICEDGNVRTIYNYVPLWYLDRLNKLPVKQASLYFTVESKEKAGEVLLAAKNGAGCEEKFTRGFY